jgi:hypothetical protein
MCFALAYVYILQQHLSREPQESYRNDSQVSWILSRESNLGPPEYEAKRGCLVILI